MPAGFKVGPIGRVGSELPAPNDVADTNSGLGYTDVLELKRLEVPRVGQLNLALRHRAKHISCQWKICINGADANCLRARRNILKTKLRANCGRSCQLVARISSRRLFGRNAG